MIMGIFTLIAACVALATGVLLLVSPESLIKLGKVFNQIFTFDDQILAYRKVYGTLFFLIGLYMIYVYFTIY
jgi:hypothetical protein